MYMAIQRKYLVYGRNRKEEKDIFAHLHVHLRLALVYSFPVEVRA